MLIHAVIFFMLIATDSDIFMLFATGSDIFHAYFYRQ